MTDPINNPDDRTASEDAYNRASMFVVNELTKVLPPAAIGLENGVKVIHAIAALLDPPPGDIADPNEAVKALREKLGDVRIEQLMPDEKTGRLFVLVSYSKDQRETVLPGDVLALLKRLGTPILGRPKLTHVAIRDTEDRIWSLPAPLRHMHVQAVMREHGAVQKPDNQWNQGFLDETGRYLTRKQAIVNAELNDQILNGRRINQSTLLSEDVW
jgi:hypothetical protein